MSQGQRYKAFISYSHRDAKWGKWLLRRLETYRLPARLVGRQTARGPAPERLAPVFQDREELPAASDLTDQVRAAMERSENMVVICSPNSAQSQWVNKEILEFKRMRGEDRVFAVIVDGEPFASEAGDPARECFPPALRYRLGPTGDLSGDAAEPLAADIRRHADGKRLGHLKLTAGLAGLGLDDLMPREMQRRNRRVMAVTLASLAGVIIMSAIAWEAVDARREAEDRRADAEGLIEFMLTDLRDRLEPVGRLDVLDAVAEEAVGYYASGRLDEMPGESIGRQARAFHLLGEIDQLKGDLDGAAAMFQDAWDMTAANLDRDPDNPQRIYDHAQSVYWLGYMDWRRGNYADAEDAFRLYRTLAGRLLDIDPDNTTYRREVGHAETNLGVLYLSYLNQPERAKGNFLAASEVWEGLLASEPTNVDLLYELANTHGWLADTIWLTGDLREARHHRAEQLSYYRDALQLSPDNMKLRARLLQAQLGLARVAFDTGDAKTALATVASARDEAEELIAYDPENTDWLRHAALLELHLAEFHLSLRDLTAAEAALSRAADLEQALSDKAAITGRWRTQITLQQQLLRAQHAQMSGERREAARLAAQVLNQLSPFTGQQDPSFLGLYLQVAAERMRGEVAGESDIAGETISGHERVLELVDTDQTHDPKILAELAYSLAHMGRMDDARRLASNLKARGFHRPDFQTFCRDRLALGPPPENQFRQ